MAAATTQILDPTDGTTPVTLPTQDACCQSPCDPPWRTKPSCVTFTETKSSVVSLARGANDDSPREGVVIINVTYTHTLCLIGKQHGGLAYTLTLLPGEKMTLYHSDRYRRTTSETERYSVQTTFAQFISALYQQQNSNDSSLLVQVLNNQTQGSSSSFGGGFARAPAVQAAVLRVPALRLIYRPKRAPTSSCPWPSRLPNTPTSSDRLRSAATRTPKRFRRPNGPWSTTTSAMQ
jgi:hypothetical protein